MSYYNEPDGPTYDDELAADYDNLREYCNRLQDLIRSMVDAKDPLMDVADAVSFYDAWCKEAEELLPKPREAYAPIQSVTRADDDDPF